MEERIIDDEYGRGIRLRKTKDGYVDVTDEIAGEEEKETAVPGPDGVAEDGATQLTADGTENETEEDVVVGDLEESLEDLDVENDGEGEEVTFEFPELEEDDEDLVNLTPEEALELRRKKEAEEAQRKADYKRLCGEGDELLLSGSFKAAELKFEKALALEENAWEAVVGYWRAKTSDFSRPDELMNEYLETGYDSLESDLGEDAVEAIKKQYREVFEARLAEVSEAEEELGKEVLAKQSKRRAILRQRISATRGKFIGTAVPTALFLILGIVFGYLITTRRDGLFLYLTIAAGVLFAVSFVAFGIFTNRFVNARRINRANEDLSSTEEGERLLELRAYKELYGHFGGWAVVLRRPRPGRARLRTRNIPGPFSRKSECGNFLRRAACGSRAARRVGSFEKRSIPEKFQCPIAGLRFFTEFKINRFTDRIV